MEDAQVDGTMKTWLEGHTKHAVLHNISFCRQCHAYYSIDGNFYWLLTGMRNGTLVSKECNEAKREIELIKYAYKVENEAQI